MQPTSHFLGLALRPMLLDDLFDELFEYIREYQLQDIVQLQSRESPHITIYYLDAIFTDNEKTTCLELLQSWKTEIKIHVSLGNIGYFYRENSPYILYIAPDNIAYFAQKNKQASEQLHRDDIVENQFLFVPHITIIRILDTERFVPYSDAIEKIIRSHIERLGESSISDGFALYSVDSLIQIELQERLALS